MSKLPLHLKNTYPSISWNSDLIWILQHHLQKVLVSLIQTWWSKSTCITYSNVVEQSTTYSNLSKNLRVSSPLNLNYLFGDLSLSTTLLHSSWFYKQCMYVACGPLWAKPNKASNLSSKLWFKIRVSDRCSKRYIIYII